MAWVEPAPVDNYFEAAAVDVELDEPELESLDELEEDFSELEVDLSDDELEESEPLEEPFDDVDGEVDDELLDASRLSLR